MNRFGPAERVADAVLYEGLVLYPYRASSVKNRVRWQFGIVAPRPPREEDGEPWFSQTECLVETAGSARLGIRVRFLRVQRRGDRNGWLDAAPQAIDIDLGDVAGDPVSRIVPLETEGVTVRVVIETTPLNRRPERPAPPVQMPAPPERFKVRVRLENLEPWQPAFAACRDAMLEHSLVGAHLLLALDSGTFVSLLDPPADAAAAAAACVNRHAWPVLVGDRSRRDVMLSSPIVLYDYPSVAPESPADLCDCAEIDEILSLRILTLTDDEKQEARATDPRARAIIDHVDGLTPDGFAALHGTMRAADFFNPPGTPAPEDASIEVAGTRIRKGSHVRLRPVRRADAMDMFLRDQPATVAGVYHDLDDRAYVAVTVDADPAAAMHGSFGRYFYFNADEIEPLEPDRSVRLQPDR